MAKNISQTRTIEKSAVITAARRALITANEKYFSLSEEEQEVYRATKDDKAIQRIKCSVLRDLLKIQAKIDSIDDLWSELSKSDLNTLNWCLLLTDGIGDDFIFVNESFSENTSILDFTTLYDYDFADYLFQERTKKEELSQYEPKDYYPFRWSPWIRLLVDSVFSYATLTSVASYIYDELEEFGNNYIDHLIPNELVKGPEHNQKTDGGILWDMKIDAMGLEGQLDELKIRWNSYREQRWIDISQSQSLLKPSVCILDDNASGELDYTFIFNNTNALKAVRWRRFSSDCGKLIADDRELKYLVDIEIKKAHKFIDDNYQDVMDNFDPTVVKFRAKKRVIISPGFLDDLNDID